MCFTIVPDPIPETFDQFCSALVFDDNHTAASGALNDAGYFIGDDGFQTQYVVNGMGSVVAADDEAIQFLWTGDAGFDGTLADGL